MNLQLMNSKSVLHRHLLTFLFLINLSVGSYAQQFIHPGLLQSNDDIARIKKGIAEKKEPVYSGFLVFQAHPQSQYTYRMQGPMAMVGRNATVGQGTYDCDANAAYQNALMWALTGNHAYAGKSIEIVNKWSATLKSITGKDAVLMAGLGPFKMVNAAEILRHTHSGWTEADALQTEKHFKEVIYPVIKDFAPFANGNWDSAALKTVMAIAIFCNDREMFEHSLRYYVDGSGDGRLINYIINEDGECQESGRDQGHTQLGIAHLGDCSEIAWHQGLNLYAYANNRLLKGFEYTARYNLDMDVPYAAEMDRTGKYLHPKISEESRGKLRAVYEQIYNHYVNRMGLQAPYTQQAAEKIRPELQGLPGADHVGFGTLLYSRPGTTNEKTTNKALPAAPAGLVAKTAAAGNTLTWIESIGAEHYTVKRSEKKEGPYITIGEAIAAAEYTDTKIQQGKKYYYTVTAANKSGESNNAWLVAIIAGLPHNFKELNINSVKGYAAFDGNQLTIEGGGMASDSTNDQFNFLYQSLNGDGSITIRYVPQISSQFTSFGLAIREALTGNSAQVSLVLSPQASRQIEAPGWYIKLLERNSAGSSIKTVASSGVLTEPGVTNNRLTDYCWLRLERKGNEFNGYSSTDGKNWIKIGSTVLPLKKQAYVGIPVSSGVASITTTVKLDNLNVNGNPINEN